MICYYLLVVINEPAKQYFNNINIRDVNKNYVWTPTVSPQDQRKANFPQHSDLVVVPREWKIQETKIQAQFSIKEAITKMPAPSGRIEIAIKAAYATRLPTRSSGHS